jgi:hypothetical protein
VCDPGAAVNGPVGHSIGLQECHVLQACSSSGDVCCWSHCKACTTCRDHNSAFYFAAQAAAAVQLMYTREAVASVWCKRHVQLQLLELLQSTSS